MTIKRSTLRKFALSTFLFTLPLNAALAQDAAVADRLKATLAAQGVDISWTGVTGDNTSMGIGDGTLGLALIGTPIGTLTALTLATPLLERVGFRRALLALVPLLALAYAVAVHAPGPLALFLMLLPVGLMIGSIEIMMFPLPCPASGVAFLAHQPESGDDDHRNGEKRE